VHRRSFLKASAAGAAALSAVPTSVVAQSQPFKVGMAATLWLQADAATETYWKACRAIAELGF
jgi:hypothetical protein